MIGLLPSGEFGSFGVRSLMFKRFHLLRDMRAILTSIDQLLKNIHRETEKKSVLSEHILKLLNEKVGRLPEHIAQQTNLLEDKFGNLHESIANQTGLLNDKLGNLHGGLAHQTSLLNDKLGSLHEGIAHQTS